MVSRIFGIAFALGVLLFSYFLGLLSGVFKHDHFVQLERGISIVRAAMTTEAERVYIRAGLDLHLWRLNPTEGDGPPKKGVTVYLPEKSSPGVTLIAENRARAILLDEHGKLLNAWSKPSSAAFPEESLSRLASQNNTDYWHDVHLFPNGDLLAVYHVTTNVPYASGFLKLDRDSNILWRYPAHAHHDFSIGPDGEIYLLTLVVEDNETYDLDFISPPFLDEFLVVLSNNGKEQKRISLMQAILDSPFRNYINLATQDGFGDVLHTNEAEYITPEFAQHYPQFEPGQILLSFRNTSTIAALDLEEERLVWALAGSWNFQHDPDLLSSGRILLFNNVNTGSSESSSVIEFDPITLKRHWVYPPNDEIPFFSEIRGQVQRLPNGNTLITESGNGRVIEVTPRGELVWEYISDQRKGTNKEFIAIVANAERYSRAQLTFLDS